MIYFNFYKVIQMIHNLLDVSLESLKIKGPMSFPPLNDSDIYFEKMG